MEFQHICVPSTGEKIQVQKIFLSWFLISRLSLLLRVMA